MAEQEKDKVVLEDTPGLRKDRSSTAENTKSWGNRQPKMSVYRN
jgi:hypothetical protein